MAVMIWLFPRFNAINQSTITTESGTHVAFCDLIGNPRRYYSRTIRVQAILVGYHELGLYDPACQGEYIRADFDSSSRQKLIEAINTLDGSGFQRGNFWVKVVLAGRLEAFQGSNRIGEHEESELSSHQRLNYRSRFVVLNVEHVETVPHGISWTQ